MTNETTQFEVGQAVEYHSFDGAWKPANITDIQEHDNFTVLVLVTDNGAQFSRRIGSVRLVRPIQSDPTPQPAAIQYPPLRTMKNDHEPMQTWQQVLDSKPLAERQPHLYLLGQYELVTISMMEHFKSVFIVLECVPLPDTTVYYRVFIITEGA